MAAEPPGDPLTASPITGTLADEDDVDLWAVPVMAQGTQYEFTIAAHEENSNSVFTISAYLKDMDRYSEAPWADYPDFPVFTADSDAEPTILMPSYMGDEVFMIAVTSNSGYGEYTLSYTLKPASTISGTVTGTVPGPGATASPVADIDVKAYLIAGEDDNQVYHLTNWAATGEDGTYTIEGLLPGDYLVEFSDESGTYGRQYFDGQSRRSTATAVEAAEADGSAKDVTGINAALQSGSSIEGRVVNNQGLGLPNVSVHVWAMDGDSPYQVDIALTDSQGAYTVVGLAQGSYRIAFSDDDNEYVSEFYNDATSIEEATAVEIADVGQNVSLDTVDLARGVRIEGRVQNSWLKGLQGVLVEAYRPFDLEDPVGFDITGQGGTYGIGSLPAGEYIVCFNNGAVGPTIWVDGTEYGYSVEWYDNAATADEATPVSVGADRIATGIDAVLFTGYEPAAACAVAPGRFARSATTGWVKDVQTLTFTTEFRPPLGALGVDALGEPEPELESRTQIHYTLDGGSFWEVVAGVEATADVDDQGSHEVQYFASNQFGAEEVKTAGYVNYDSIKPKTRAYSATVNRNRNVTLRYRINDFVPGSARAAARLLIKKGKKTLRTINLGTRRANVTLSYKYRANLAKGKYTLLVTATDLAGNVATQRTAGTLTIK